MSTQILASSYSNENPYKIVRSTKTFHPHIWGEQFLHYNISEQDWYCQQQKVEKLKEVIRREIFGESSSSSAYYDSWKNQLKLIDVVERLGLSYHFESEIENMIEQIYNKTNSDDFLKDEDLHDVSLWFTLLRQHGFRVSSDIFEKFKDEDGNFKKYLVSDTLGLLSLYEASHLSCVGENILDEALAFTTTHLIEFLAKTKDHYDDDDFLSKEISQALERPLRKTLVNLHAKHFISIYEKDASHNKVLLQLAKLDFNLLQSMHKEELSEISRKCLTELNRILQ
ncbi:alpha-humulene synthase-like isoform X2 [Cannabis sativa]|uniref:alpha-humulene synthase-like isoform X2 n=1 Tax=Cannabis sativa TaxID=3483 RepID=UPI0029C9E745|nr:alpha-humulene synthase-like isoform X2 [Cannabis sativa]